MNENVSRDKAKASNLGSIVEDCFWIGLILTVIVSIILLMTARFTKSPIPLIRSEPYVVQLPDNTFSVCHTVLVQRYCVYKPSANRVETGWSPASEVSGPGYTTVEAARASWPFNNAHYGRKVK